MKMIRRVLFTSYLYAKLHGEIKENQLSRILYAAQNFRIVENIVKRRIFYRNNLPFQTFLK